MIGTLILYFCLVALPVWAVLLRLRSKRNTRYALLILVVYVLALGTEFYFGYPFGFGRAKQAASWPVLPQREAGPQPVDRPEWFGGKPANAQHEGTD